MKRKKKADVLVLISREAVETYSFNKKKSEKTKKMKETVTIPRRTILFMHMMFGVAKCATLLTTAVVKFLLHARMLVGNGHRQN